MMILSETFLEAFKKAGIDPNEVAVAVSTGYVTYRGSRLSFRWPSPMSSLISEVHVEGEKLKFQARGRKYGYGHQEFEVIPLAVPDLIDRIAALIVERTKNMKSKYLKKEKKGAE
jgi:hypothetical protein